MTDSPLISVITPTYNRAHVLGRAIRSLRGQTLGRYEHIIGEGRQFFTMQATRGCPAACTFCDIRKTKFRERTPENVVKEIELLVEMGVDDLFFVDDTITINKKNLNRATT